ncbi:hypothetical protein V8G54_005190 [Vigna mungo]|uniref:Uncharacterized protein n=1 Tax=Vigna mungo TaxID=3915 RepID=A0AAQ3PF76_VIGMU
MLGGGTRAKTKGGKIKRIRRHNGGTNGGNGAVNGWMQGGDGVVKGGNEGEKDGNSTRLGSHMPGFLRSEAIIGGTTPHSRATSRSDIHCTTIDCFRQVPDKQGGHSFNVLIFVLLFSSLKLLQQISVFQPQIKPGIALPDTLNIIAAKGEGASEWDKLAK